MFRGKVFRRSGLKYAGVPGLSIPAFRRSGFPAFRSSGFKYILLEGHGTFSGAALMIACEQAPQWGKSVKINQRAERAKSLFTGYAHEIFWLLNPAALIRGRRFFE